MAVLCPACNTENRDGARFCKGCGGKLTPLGAPAPVLGQAPSDWVATEPAPLLHTPAPPAARTDPNGLHPAAREIAGVTVSSPAFASSPSAPKRSKGWLVGLGGAVALLLVVGVGWLAYASDTPKPVLPAAAAVAPVALPAPVAPPAAEAPIAPVVPVETIAPAAPVEVLAPAEPVIEPVPPAPAAAPPSSTVAPLRAAAPRPRKTAVAVPPPIVAPMPVPVPLPVPEPPPPAVPQAGCAGRNFIANAQCMATQCLKAEFKAHPQCDAVRKQQRLEDERRNLY